jgi:predicted DCC family thiol-disulfide oxidoreductase YuxK
VVFFVGVCGLCNGFVDFALARDHRRVFLFAPLQGETAAARVPEDAVPYDAPGDPRSLVLWKDGAAHRKSEAVLGVLAGLGGVWSSAGLLRMIPRVFRDAAYDFVASRRYRWFGRRAACRMPAPGERERFLP